MHLLAIVLCLIGMLPVSCNAGLRYIRDEGYVGYFHNNCLMIHQEVLTRRILNPKSEQLFIDYLLIAEDNVGVVLQNLSQIDFKSIEIGVIDVKYEDDHISQFLVERGYQNIGYYDFHQRFIRFAKNFGGWSMSKELFDYIRQLLPAEKTVLELGSGWASGELSKYYNVYSIEHDPIWLNKYKTHYIHAPIKNGWYDVEAVKKGLPTTYDLIIVDGPPGFIGRGGFYTNLSLFNTNVPIIFDDVNRPAELELMQNVSRALQREYIIITDSAGKQFGVMR